jgi:N-carbamoyl-L-amino-acid hydrolase
VSELAIRINPERLIADMQTFRRFGAQGTGVVRRALSPEDVTSRGWLAERFEEVGLAVSTDRFGNVFGCDPRYDRALLIGSHGDTQPTGGWLDGAMGVIIALEVARAAQECGIDTGIGIDAVSWSDEEGRFDHFVGSRAYCGQFSEEDMARARDEEGVLLTQAIEAAGYAGLPERAISPGRHIAYLEPHIEQGPVLDSAGLQLGVVDAIVGAREFLVRFSGQSNHAGTSPMALRRDAGKAMIRFAALLDERYSALADGKIVWTFGRIELVPNAPSIVPESASITVQFRGPDLAVLDRFEAEMLQLLDQEGYRDRGVTCAMTRILDYIPTPLDARVTLAIAKAAERVAPGRWKTMASGAGHDAQFLAPLMPTGMLFVPSIGGISHSFSEDTAIDDIILGARATAYAAYEVAVDIGRGS